MQETRHILQFSEISGVRRNPSTTENGKFPRYNNTTGKFDYACIGDGGDSDINTEYFETFITNIINTVDTNTYLSEINKEGYSGIFTMSNGVNLTLDLGALAWEDTVEATLTLPGDTKVLFDESDSIGGSFNFTYNYTSDKVQFKTPLTFDTTEGSYKEGLRYLGNYSWSIGGGDLDVPTKSGSYNLLSGFKAGATFGASSTKNTLIGSYTGQYAGAALEGSIFIGTYSGRYEDVSNKFFLDNVDYGGTAAAQAGSFLYADLDVERRLYVRDRLSVEKEGKFGTSGLVDASGEYGMYQMSAATGGVPQWHDGTVWQDFANSTDTYLSSASYADGEITFTLSDTSTVGPLDISAVNTTTFATSPSSPPTGQTATSNYGYLQISNNSFTNNEGFTYVTGLYYSSVNNTLVIPEGLQLTSTTTTTYPNGTIYQDGTHGYIRLGDVSVQIDNDAPVGESIDGENIGGATYEVFKQRSDDNLQFRTFKNIPLGTNNPNDRIKFEYSTDGDAIYIGTTAEKNRLDSQPDAVFGDVILDRDNSGETLLMRCLRPGTGVTLTQNEEFILIDATGAGGGEVNTMINLGAGEGVYYQKTGAQFEMKSLTAADTRLSYTSTTSEIDIDIDLTLTGATESIVGTYTDSDTVFSRIDGATGTTPTVYFKPLVSNTITFTTSVNDELQLEVSAISPTGTNNGGGTITIFDPSSTMPDFEFKTIRNSGDHLTIVDNANQIQFDVEHITLTDVGTGVYSLLQTDTTTNSFDFTQKAFSGINGIDLSTSTTTDIVINQTKEIPKFSFTSTPSFTVGTPTTGTFEKGLLEFKTNYDDDIRGTESLTANTMFELNIGYGLGYDSVNNVLGIDSSILGSNANYFLTSATIDSISSSTESTITLLVGDALDGDSIATYTLDIPKYQLPKADYTTDPGIIGDLGGVKILRKDIDWVLDTQRHLTLDGATGRLSIPHELVTYDEQNYLYNEQNVIVDPTNGAAINTKRTQARSNIGAAYIQGSSTVDFNADDLTVTTQLDASNTTVTHQIGDLITDDNKLYSDVAGEVTIASSSTTSAAHNPRIVQTATTTKIYIDSGSTGLFEIYSADSTGGTSTKIFAIDASGNLYIKGNIYAGADIEGFDTDNLVGVGITA